MNHGLKVSGNILEITIPENIYIDKVIVNRQIFSQRMQVCESCKYHGLEGHEEPCVSCEVGSSNYVPSIEQEERTEKRTETHACDCISRQDAINAFEPDHPVDWYATMIVDVLEDLPSVEPRKKGEWVRNFDGNEWYWYCSSCKEQWYEEDLWMGGNDFPNFCPNCGADMREGEEDDSV